VTSETYSDTDEWPPKYKLRVYNNMTTIIYFLKLFMDKVNKKYLI